jgi:hypothetical protein
VNSGRPYWGSTTVLVVAAVLSATPLVANGQVIFDGQTGETLLSSLRNTYTPSVVEMYPNAEDLLYDVLYRDNDGAADGVYCVYTGFFVPFDGQPSTDPSQDVTNFPFQDSLGMSIEHTWPQSKGAGSGNAAVNMHHLFPAKRDVNFARASLPFGDVDDSETSVWYRENSSTVEIPTENIDEYSELLSGQFFEPREDDKGNVARAMFYFYTIYRDEADAADPAFFNLQKNTLRDWHFADLPDSVELARSNAIANYQSGMINPFVQDITLIDRAYFEPELPVELIRFDLLIDEPEILVSWQTGSERNSAFFTLSLARDLEEPRVVVVPAAGDNREGLRSYEHRFRERRSGVFEISLSQTDLSGAKEELARRSLYLNGLDDGYVYPNPSDGIISLVLPGRFEDTKPEIEIFDGSGRLYRFAGRRLETISGTEIRINASSLPNGVYFARLAKVGLKSTKSFVINR